MYTIMIVDDEENIREGIKNNYCWENLNISTVLTASNGREALAVMEQTTPHLVITDIKMPVMDGLELIKKAHEQYPDVLFALLSGYEEFEFARTALQYHVFGYLLKPCSLESILSLLTRMLDHIKQQEEKKAYINKITEDYDRLKSAIQEQTLKDYILNYSFQEDYLLKNKDFFELRDIPLRLLLFQIDTAVETENLFALVGICRDYYIQKHSIFLCSICNEQVLLITEYYSFPLLRKDLEEIKNIFSRYYDQTLTVAVGEKTEMTLLKGSYRNLLTCLKSHFYTGTSNIITTFDLPGMNKNLLIENFNLEYLGLAIKSGNTEELMRLLDHLFLQLNNSEYDTNQIRAYAIQVYVYIIRQAQQEQLLYYLSGIESINRSLTLADIEKILKATALDIIKELHQNVQKGQNNLIRQILGLIDEHLADENLALGMLANEILYVNVDYLGKLFKSETDMKFSRYVTNKRIEKAKQLLLENQIQVNEVALMTGFGYNSQYFSKVFKRETGYTPKEYRSNFYTPYS